MLFRQLIDPDLGCACYLVGDGGRAVVVDPGLDVEPILACAEEEGVTIELILETHVHADHVSGRAPLALRTGAAIRLPAGAGVDPGVNAGELRDGDLIDVGDLRIAVHAAPGHRPEHIALTVADASRASEPWMLLSGDSLLVGDLARPDLAIDAHEGALALHATVGRLAALGPEVELWPGHVGGSLCGGANVSRRRSSTLGYEQRANPLLAVGAEELAQRLIDSLPTRPPTVEHVVARNRSLAPPTPALQLLAPSALAARVAAGATVFDARAASDFDAAHLAGSLNLPLRGTGLGTRAAWVVDPADELIVVSDDEASAHGLARRLRAVALDRIAGLAVGDVTELAAAGDLSLDAVPAIPIGELPGLLGEVTVIDVRDGGEWADGHVADAIHLPLSRLRDGAAALPGGPLAVICARGPRAAFAASWLRAHGHDARRVADGGPADLSTLGLALVAA